MAKLSMSTLKNYTVVNYAVYGSCVMEIRVHSNVSSVQ